MPLLNEVMTSAFWDNKTLASIENMRRELRDLMKYLVSDGGKKYEPDFIVETADAIYMCETKAEKDVNDPRVKAKADAAREFCRRASEFTDRNGGKPWKYIIIPHTLVDRSYSFNYILKQVNLK
ncbi:MAG: hypothetical protein PUE10_07090 [Bacteroidales bacterium]|nr:hypothetical protein [Bacteroidales bacterium]